MSTSSLQPPVNPYTPPSAEVTAPSNKAYRINLINRRSTAVLLELAAWHVTGGMILSVLFQWAGGASIWFGFAAAAPYWLLRDLIGFSSITRKWAGLRLTGDDGATQQMPTVGQRLLRNLLLVLPLMAIVEYFVAYYGDEQMRRLGDRMAGTCVVDVDPARARRGSYSGALVGALALNYVAALISGVVITAIFGAPKP